MSIWLYLIGTIGNIVCFWLGAYIGAKVDKGEKIEIPNPIKATTKAIQDHKAKVAEDEQLKKLETIIDNIEKYDGTPNGQKDVR